MFFQSPKFPFRWWYNFSQKCFVVVVLNPLCHKQKQTRPTFIIHIKYSLAIYYWLIFARTIGYLVIWLIIFIFQIVLLCVARRTSCNDRLHLCSDCTNMFAYHSFLCFAGQKVWKPLGYMIAPINGMRLGIVMVGHNLLFWLQLCWSLLLSAAFIPVQNILSSDCVAFFYCVAFLFLLLRDALFLVWAHPNPSIQFFHLWSFGQPTLMGGQLPLSPVNSSSCPSSLWS